jgi:hypothetical protein
MKTIILGIVISAASLFSIAPSAPAPVEIFPSAEAATCKPILTRCSTAQDCCSLYCKQVSSSTRICQPGI